MLFDCILLAKDVVNGVFAEFEQNTTKTAKQLRAIDGWKQKIVEWIREENLDGKKLMEISVNKLSRKMRLKLVPGVDEKSKEFRKLTGATQKILKICRKTSVDRILTQAKAHNAANDNLKINVVQQVCIISLWK